MPAFVGGGCAGVQPVASAAEFQSDRRGGVGYNELHILEQHELCAEPAHTQQLIELMTVRC